MSINEPRSTIGLKQSTKTRLDKCRAPGQCYDGFLCQLVDMWSDVNSRKSSIYSRKISNG
ncbi:MAG: hypothetical protein PHT28_03335 [Dehalococcoidales bacterium]|jgi:hypothetical protein|nr:hypothetical protein [Dehalococcoidales bacterium]MDD4230528.1 hypothetical protein [Dehalococcoidales bacterium]MDD4465880.1 hypothetical protein [Dehalococcoidales bacterium]MDD5402356.1 hypothetical protein [Dehalococcoidales bacterium]